ncbi:MULTISPECIES: polyprenyl diphosphate synthase [Providencia]|uniref:Ditrans,polycis-undecaprenyl-diphosphate synthase ((2E,6E)-farnesyl-diphosphate specific) n=2 Tax=Providencia rettgeri TaxID=587 RepID=A0AB35LBT6_PRORE|nr:MULTISPECIES: polyprenyl diphosphate synthase [Providencia]AWS50828.1 (2E,6E)-farnesyl- diphosphate-specific ditrans,polycis-undecaprenyl-diphosphate synthase [Providencia rettgeri]EHZ7763336.1 di-trans,poly-cis-decaprenylcistransferase [Providencia rettgeri]EIJ7166478.1 di-trans,poly-cis-decaprenylcistransferase [Providencia rettgeri]EJD6047419.1 di-trans,poly-cis-decaprenylcistransferase [Providencia rettgeri]EJD6376155.1 di-trans,poly-cis-decaprenylcistransferase [Providencia rettgeri]
MNSSGENLSDSMMPKHVAIIMDGNGRWAKQRGKLRITGHKAGVESVRNSVRFAVKNKISSLTLYAFSSENWRRPEKEVSSLMELFVFALDNEVKNLHKNNVKLKVIGDISRFSERLRKRIDKAEALTQNNTGLKLNIAANYGGRWDISNSVKQVFAKVQSGELSIDDINEENINDHICMHDQENVDLVIRTGGEHRISNFLLWQVAYAEFYFTNVLWPDFDEMVFQSAVDAFSKRERRYGGAESDDELGKE